MQEGGDKETWRETGPNNSKQNVGGVSARASYSPYIFITI